MFGRGDTGVSCVRFQSNKQEIGEKRYRERKEEQKAHSTEKMVKRLEEVKREEVVNISENAVRRGETISSDCCILGCLTGDGNRERICITPVSVDTEGDLALANGSGVNSEGANDAGMVC